jgi:uncharacterized repeat protein (TIGR03803 family)
MKRIILLFTVAFCLFTLNVYSQTPHLWGMTSMGGENGDGSIFRMDVNGENQTVIYSFYDEGYGPKGSLVRAANDKLYGFTELGGTGAPGTMFEFDPVTETFATKIDFDGAISGSGPSGSLIEVSSNLLYGMTQMGGTNDRGVIFEYNATTEVFIKKFDFGGENGEQPHGSLLKASNGLLYGMTAHGGEIDQGVLFEFNPGNSSFTKLHDFIITSGRTPTGSLIQVSDKLYGLTQLGGIIDNLGVLFEYDLSTEEYTAKVNFNYDDNGANPRGDLLWANGALYGLTEAGGTNGDGVLFKYDPGSEIFTTLFEFDYYESGSRPFGSLTQSSNGNFYGMTYEGGTEEKGVIFEFAPGSETYTKKLDLDDDHGIEPFYTTFIEISSPVGISDVFPDEPKFNIYPNPTSGILNIEMNIGSKEMEIVIFDVKGQIVFSQISSKLITSINTNKIEYGIYFLKIISEGNTVHQMKFVKV